MRRRFSSIYKTRWSARSQVEMEWARRVALARMQLTQMPRE